MKNFNTRLESFLIQKDVIALTRVILLIGPMVILLLAVLGLALQLNRQLADKQQVSLNQIVHLAVRNSAQLQREHLRLQTLIERGTHNFDRSKVGTQRDLVWSRLRVLENPVHIGHASSDVIRALHTYRTRWEAIQPLLDRWLIEPSDQPTYDELIAEMSETEKLANNLIAIGHLSFEDRLISWAASSKRLNELLTGASSLFIFMILLMTYVIYQFSRAQSRIAQVLRSSEQRLSAILETIPDAVFRLTRKGVYVDVKPAQKLGMLAASDQILGKHITQVLPLSIAEAVIPVIQQAFATGQEQLCEYQLLEETTARVRDFEARILPSGTDEVQIIVRDITTDKQQEESALQAQKLESLGVLAGGIAHDFNNLLTGMLAHTSLAKLKLVKGLPAIDHIDKAALSAERAADLTRQLLAYAGKGKFQIVPLDVNQLICETTGLMQTALPSHVELELDLDHALPRIEADRGQIQQVVMNLFINAMEALSEKSGYIKISTAFQQITATHTMQGYLIGNLRPGPYLLLQVVDSGIGMDQAVLSRIFDPFFSTKLKGHGLGLSATMGIIRTHHGGLQVQSQPGRGTTFTILLPMLEFEPTQPQTVLPSEAQDHGQRQTILVIDDDDAIREVACDILTDQGFTVAAAASGYEGIEQFSRLQNQVGVVLLDMKMPGMNGKQTYAQLQKIEPDLKVIFTSGYSEEEVSGQIGNGCPLPFLAKPYSAERLIQQIQQTLQT